MMALGIQGWDLLTEVELSESVWKSSFLPSSVSQTGVLFPTYREFKPDSFSSKRVPFKDEDLYSGNIFILVPTLTPRI